MTQRFIQSVQLSDYENTKKCVRIYKDSETGEYVCKLHNAGVHYPPADYFTEDKQDAISTAEHMCLSVAGRLLSDMKHARYSNATVIDAANARSVSKGEQEDILHWQFADKSFLYYNKVRDAFTL